MIAEHDGWPSLPAGLHGGFLVERADGHLQMIRRPAGDTMLARAVDAVVAAPGNVPQARTAENNAPASHPAAEPDKIKTK